MIRPIFQFGEPQRTRYLTKYHAFHSSIPTSKPRLECKRPLITLVRQNPHISDWVQWPTARYFGFGHAVRARYPGNRWHLSLKASSSPVTHPQYARDMPESFSKGSSIDPTNDGDISPSTVQVTIRCFLDQ